MPPAWRSDGLTGSCLKVSCEKKKVELHLLQFHVDGTGVVSSTSFTYSSFFCITDSVRLYLNILYYPSTIKTRKKQREGEDFNHTLY